MEGARGLRVGQSVVQVPQKEGHLPERFVTDCFSFLAGVLGMVLGQKNKGLSI